MLCFIVVYCYLLFVLFVVFDLVVDMLNFFVNVISVGIIYWDIVWLENMFFNCVNLIKESIYFLFFLIFNE